MNLCLQVLHCLVLDMRDVTWLRELAQESSFCSSSLSRELQAALFTSKPFMCYSSLSLLFSLLLLRFLSAAGTLCSGTSVLSILRTSKLTQQTNFAVVLANLTSPVVCRTCVVEKLAYWGDIW